MNAFHLIRHYARTHNLRLSELARAISTDTDTDIDKTLAGFEVWLDHSIRTAD